MDSLQLAKELTSRGSFAEALKVLNTAVASRADQVAADVLRAQVLERLGRHGQSRSLLEQLLRSKNITSADRSICEFVLSQIDWEDGNTDLSIERLQRAISLGGEARDLRLTCWAQVRLLIALANRSGPDSSMPLLAELRSNATRLGDPQISAA